MRSNPCGIYLKISVSYRISVTKSKPSISIRAPGKWNTASCALRTREHCAPHSANRTRTAIGEENWFLERLGWGSWQPSQYFVRKLGNMDIFCCKTHRPTGCDFSGYNPAVGRPVQNWPTLLLRGNFPAEVSFYWRAFQSVTGLYVMYNRIVPAQRSRKFFQALVAMEHLRFSWKKHGKIFDKWTFSWKIMGTYPITSGFTGKIMGNTFSMEIWIYKWRIFNCHVWFSEGTKSQFTTLHLAPVFQVLWWEKRPEILLGLALSQGFGAFSQWEIPWSFGESSFFGKMFLLFFWGSYISRTSLIIGSWNPWL